MVFLTPIQTKNVRFVLVAFLVISIAIVALMFRWQIFDSERFTSIKDSRSSSVVIPSVRGSILAADGSTLAYSEPCYDVYVWLPELQTAENAGSQTRTELIDKVATVLGVDQASLVEKFATSALWIKIGSNASYAQKNELLALTSSTGKTITGIQFEYKNKRTYPEGSLASQVIGYVSQNDATGNWGLEQYWDGSLQAVEGVQSTSLDSFGNPIALEGMENIESKAGSTIYTTIDKTLQAVLEQKLKDGYNTYQAASTSGIIMDPKTGAILAMANYPAFDPNTYYDVTNASAFGNEAISSPYEIGSVAKVLTASAALDLGAITMDTVILPNGHNGCEPITPNAPEGYSCKKAAEESTQDDITCICTYNKKATTVHETVLDAMKGSDNIGFRHIALTMTYQQFHDYLVKFGVGATTNIDLAGESYAELKPADKWNYADQAVYSYGHGYSMTALQAAVAISSVANDGKRMQPYVVSKVVDADGKVTEFQPKVVEQVIKPETAAQVSDMMHQVYLGELLEKRFQGLGKYDIAMKSGTALIPYTDKAGYSGEINATFVGFDASPDKKFLMLIRVEKPQVGDLSYYNARILWLDTFLAIKDYLNLKQY
jgi:cell division protein FtsI/penicillin-binding protein 2